jgi:hypothetical protein
VLAGALDFWIHFEIVRTLHTRTASAAGTLIPRRRRRWAFWVVLAVQAAHVACIAFLVIGALRNAGL